jgi:hypothetical protein
VDSNGATIAEQGAPAHGAFGAQMGGGPCVEDKSKAGRTKTHTRATRIAMAAVRIMMSFGVCVVVGQPAWSVCPRGVPDGDIVVKILFLDFF